MIGFGPSNLDELANTRSRCGTDLSRELLSRHFPGWFT